MKKIAFYTLGCKVNQYETALLKDSVATKCQIVSDKEIADIYVINSCAVTQHSSDQARHFLRKVQKLNPKSHIIYTGCDSYLIENIASEHVHIVGNVYKKDILSALKCCRDTSAQTKTYDINVELRSIDKSRAFIKIQEGCRNFCAFCVVAHLRGKERQKEPEIVLREISHFVIKGYKEIVLTGTNIGSYNNLKDLLKQIDTMKGDFRVRISSIEPMYVDKELLDIIAQGRFARHLHIPLQSASDRVLKIANRGYTIKDFENIVNYASKKGIFIGTDIIVGFMESDVDYEATYSFLEQNDITFAHIFTYSQRPFTFKSIFIDTETLRIRMMRLKSLMHEKFIEKMQTIVGKYTEIVVESTLVERNGVIYNKATASEYFRVLTNNPAKKVWGKVQAFDGEYAYFEN